MDITQAIISGKIDAGIGLENVQCVELEAYCETVGRPKSDVRMLRIDELAKLGTFFFDEVEIVHLSAR